MPAKSAKQFGYMAAHLGSDDAVGGPSKPVAKEFVNKTPLNKKKKFADILAKNKNKKVMDTDNDKM